MPLTLQQQLHAMGDIVGHHHPAAHWIIVAMAVALRLAAAVHTLRSTSDAPQ